ncbi:tRNA-splicing ligase RtcB-domain-containing protein [Zopfochytrium polystomum]|nr:tRNA-splicing ligase RtcB-domain-containing protein [Zopfochytrium polystomum]
MPSDLTTSHEAPSSSSSSSSSLSSSSSSSSPSAAADTITTTATTTTSPATSLRLTLASNANRSVKSVVLVPVPASHTTPTTALRAALLDLAKRKLRIKKPLRLYTSRGAEIVDDAGVPRDADAVVLVSAGEPFVGTTTSTTAGPATAAAAEDGAPVVLLAESAPVDPDAMQQLRATARLPGMLRAVGLPDLCPGNRFPVGAAFVVEGRIYPELIGGDIGCGMTLYTLPTLSADRINAAKIAARLHSLDRPYPRSRTRRWLGDLLSPDPPSNTITSELTPAAAVLEDAFGTIGAGNHFAELQVVDEVRDAAALAALGLDAGRAVLLVHSGSRRVGKDVLDRYVDAARGAGAGGGGGNSGLAVAEGTREFAAYMREHDRACAWARRNRVVIARRWVRMVFGLDEGCGDDDDDDEDEAADRAAEGGAELCGGRAVKLIDIWHNNVEVLSVGGDGAGGGGEERRRFVHRKGAAPSTHGIVPIPGSRGARTYLVRPLTDDAAAQERCGYSLPHGAGRLLTRTKARTHVASLYSASGKKGGSGGGGGGGGLDTRRLLTTAIGSTVVCEDRELLVEEAPEAYKDIDAVVRDVAGVAEVVAVLRPIVSYKYRA